MRIKFLKDFRGKETKEIFYPAGSVVEDSLLKDSGAADRLIAEGVAEAYTGPETVVFVSPYPVVDPELQIKPTAIGKAEALVNEDNAKILENLKADEEAKVEAKKAAVKKPKGKKAAK